MDDPWGSPWADEIQPPRPAKTVSQNDGDGHRSTPRDFVQISSLALQGQTNLPWGGADGRIPADDDIGFGEWASVPSKPGAPLDGANNAWAGRPDDKYGKGLNKEHANGVLAGWDDVPTILEDSSIKLGPSLLPATSNLARQPSPDPWASISETGITNDTNHDSVECLKYPDRVTTKRHQSDQSRKDQSLQSLPVIDTTSTVLATNNESKGDRKPMEVEVDDYEGSSDLTVQPETPSNLQEVRPTFSIPSSSPSEQSHHDANLSESPRTSMDEEPKPSQIRRKSSLKVQELVQHFDTLAKEEATDMTSGRTSVTEGFIRGDKEIGELEPGEDEEDDFGDFEEGHSEIDGSATETTAAEITPPAQTLNTSKEVAEKVAGDGSQVSSSPASPKIKTYGPIEFVPDASIVAKLYPNSEEPPPVDRPCIPNEVPHDSFSTVEERKMWYRVSRYGPMRQHNAGADENYVRVNWAQSQVRVESQKIVARWIEEDRISGRVVLGGGSKAGSIFGWNDSKTKPASIATAFAAKKMKDARVATVEPVAEVPREWPKGLARDRSTSKGGTSPKARRRSSAKSIQTPEQTKPEKQLPVADFGWNTDIGSNGIQNSPPRKTSLTHRASGSNSSIMSSVNIESPQAQSPSSRSAPAPTNSSFKDASRGRQTLSPAVTLPTILSPSILPSSSQNVAPTPVLMPKSTDDDEWGEMISSPVIAAPPAFSPSKGLRHKKSQSLGGWATSRNQGLTSVQHQAPSIPYERGHRPTLSFDDILTPKHRNPQGKKAVNAFNSSYNTAPSYAIQSTKSSVAPSLAGSADPWASADFSFFESAPAPPVPPKNSPVPKSNTASLRSVPRATVEPDASTHGRKSRDEMEQDNIVQSTLKSLPDLSYMFKR